jgi:hypothetical protein
MQAAEKSDIQTTRQAGVANASLSLTFDLLFLNFLRAAKSSARMLSGARLPESPPWKREEEELEEEATMKDYCSSGSSKEARQDSTD